MAKIRLGFVSNSSSSSFTIDKSRISKYQYYCLMNPEECIKDIARKEYFDSEELQEDYSDFDEYWKYFKDGHRIGCIEKEDILLWSVTEKENGLIYFQTFMNNFSYVNYADRIGIPDEAFIEKEY